MELVAEGTLSFFLILALALLMFLIFLILKRPRRPHLIVKVGTPEKIPNKKG